MKTPYEIICEKCQKVNFYGMVQNQIEHYRGPDSPPEIECDFREPQLSDVLLALGSNYAVDGQGYIQKFSVLHPRYSGYVNVVPHVIYDLTKSVSKQSTEVLEFLASKLSN